MTLFRTVLAGALVLAASRTGAGADSNGAWPRFLGPNLNGISPEKGINKDWNARPPKELWRVDLTDNGFSGPSVADGKVFIIDHQGSQDIVRAVDLAAGKEVWRFPYEDTAKADWGYARSTPTIDGQKVYTLGRLGQLHCLDVKTGKALWAVNLVKDFGGRPPQWDYSMSVLVDGEVLIVCPGAEDGSVAALNKETGKLLWKGGNNDLPGYATPIPATLNKVRQYVVGTGSFFIGVDAATGKQLWSFPCENRYKSNAPTPIAVGDNVLITSGYGRGCMLLDVSGPEAKPVWESKEMQSDMSTPILYEGDIYGPNGLNRLVCLDAKSGALKWQQKGFGKGSAMGVDGAMILIDGATGDVVLASINPSAYQELGRLKVLTKQRQYWTAPIVAHGKLIVRDQAVMVCLDLK